MIGSKSNVALWVLQVLLALFFGLASGLPKFLMPIDQIPMPVPLSQTFLWLIGTCEVLGALGLVLPGITRIRPRLTPLAAVCLVALTICAASAQLMGGNPGNAAFALVIGALAAVVAYGRRRLLPSRPSAVAAG
jgi:putative oxidoreductase